MKNIQQNFNSENIEALLYEIHADISRDNAESMDAQKSLLKTYFNKAKHYREERIKKIQERFKANGTEGRLEKQILVLSATKAIKAAERWVKSMFSGLKNTAGQKERQNQRILNILNEIDEGKTNTTDKTNLASEPIATSENGGGAVGEALAANIELKHSSEMDQEFQRRVQNDQMGNSLDRQRGAFRGQLDAMKKAKIFGKIFQVVSIIAGAAMTALTAGAASPLGAALSTLSKFVQLTVPALVQSAYQTLMRGLYSLGMKPIEDKMRMNQSRSQNANHDLHKLVQNMARDEKNYQKSQAKTQKMIDTLERAQVNSR